MASSQSSSSSLRSSARRMLEWYATKQQSQPQPPYDDDRTATNENEELEHDPLDVYRVFHEESQKLYQTQLTRNNFDLDPFERLKDALSIQTLRKFCNSLHVTSYHHVSTKNGYVYTEATVTIDTNNAATATTAAEAAVKSSSSSSAAVSSTNPNKKRRTQVSGEEEDSQRTTTTAPASSSSSSSSKHKHLQLTFRYERGGGGTDDFDYQHGSTTQVHYSIQLSSDYGLNETILWVHVVAAGNVPSHLPAKNMHDDEYDDDDHFKQFSAGNDVDENEEMENGDEMENDRDSQERATTTTIKHLKRKAENGSIALNNQQQYTSAKAAPRFEKEEKEESTSLPTQTRKCDDDDDDAEKEFGDRFVAGIDGDVLRKFLRGSNLVDGNTTSNKIDDDVAFFLLMTFPFYETEWDLVGFVLDAVFGYDDDNDNDNDETSDSSRDTDDNADAADDDKKS